MIGFVKLHRILKDWEWYKKPNMVQFLIHCLIKANHSEQTWKGITVASGEFISGRKVLSEETGLTEQQIRTCIKYLKSTSELTSTPTKGVDGNYTVFRLNSWEKYQSRKEPTKGSTSSPTVEQPSINQGLTTNKNDKKEKNEKKNINNDQFDSWFSTYAKKIGKAKTLKKWNSLTAVEQDNCMEVVADYVESTPDKQFRKNPLTYLNGSHWEDEINKPESKEKEMVSNSYPTLEQVMAFEMVT